MFMSNSYFIVLCQVRESYQNLSILPFCFLELMFELKWVQLNFVFSNPTPLAMFASGLKTEVA
jgi:hypothetical protein